MSGLGIYKRYNFMNLYYYLIYDPIFDFLFLEYINNQRKKTPKNQVETIQKKEDF